uniref:ATP-dependent zinc metalloprotease FTSH1 n=1 Tax=Zygnema circumcarinatum TaxID=35869 RepID=A0A6N0GXA9_ZYGCR|nr:ATP-dependent zinc metalloprotease FTSH1 [Zygnema circumcarinatum]
MKLDYILKNSNGWTIPKKNRSIWFSYMTSKNKLLERKCLTRFKQSHFMIHAYAENIAHTEIDVNTKTQFIVTAIYDCNSMPSWISKIRIFFLKEFQLVSHWQIRESTWPWTNLSIYSGIREALLNRYSIGKLISSSCLLYLALLDIRDGLYELFTTFHNTFKILRIMNRFSKLVRFALPTLYVGQKDYAVGNKTNQRKPSLSVLFLARPKTRDMINTLTVMLLPLVLYKIHPKFTNLNNEQVELHKLLALHDSIDTSNICNNYAVEQKSVTYFDDQYKWFEDKVCINKFNIFDKDLNLQEHSNSLNLAISNTNYSNTIRYDSPWFILSNWEHIISNINLQQQVAWKECNSIANNRLDFVQPCNDFARISTWFKWYFSSAYQQKKIQNYLYIQSGRKLTNVNWRKCCNKNRMIIDKQQSSNISYRVDQFAPFQDIDLNQEKDKQLSSKSQEWVNQIIYHNNHIHIGPVLHAIVPRFDPTKLFYHQQWWSQVFKCKQKIVQTNLMSRKVCKTTLSILNRVKYGLNANLINLFWNQNSTRFESYVLYTTKFSLPFQNLSTLLKGFQFETQRKLCRQKINTWKDLYQIRNSCKHETCIWNLRNINHSLVQPLVLKPRVEICATKLVQQNRTIAPLFYHYFRSFISESLLLDSKKLPPNNVHSQLLHLLCADTVHQKWLMSSKNLLIIKQFSPYDSRRLLIATNNLFTTKPLLYLVGNKYLNMFTCVINKSPTFEHTLQNHNPSSFKAINILLCKQMEQFPNNLIQAKQHIVKKKKIHSVLHTSVRISPCRINPLYRFNSVFSFKDNFVFQYTSVDYLIKMCATLDVLSKIQSKIKLQYLCEMIPTTAYDKLLNPIDSFHQHWSVLQNSKLNDYNFVSNKSYQTDVMLLPYKALQESVEIQSKSQLTNDLTKYFCNPLYTDTFSHVFWGTKTSSKGISIENTLKQKSEWNNRLVSIRSDFTLSGNSQQAATIRPKIQAEVAIKKNIVFSDLGLDNSLSILQMYDRWVLTSHWWRFFQKTLDNIVPAILQQVYDILNVHLVSKKYNVFLEDSGYIYRFFTRQINNIFHVDFLHIKYSEPFWQQIDQMGNNDTNLWSLSKFIQYPTANEYATFAWLAITYCIYFHSLSTYTGLAYLNVWNTLNKIRHLVDASWNTQIDLMVYKNTVFPSATLRWESYCSQSEIMLLHGTIYSQWIGTFIISKWCLDSSTVDLSVYEKEKGIVEQCVLSKEALIKFQKTHKVIANYHNLSGQIHQFKGLHYLHELTQSYIGYDIDKILTVNSSSISRPIYYAFDSVNNSSQFNAINVDKQRLWQSNLTQERNSIIPLELEYVRPIGLLLIGPKESGKSYLAKSLAANANVLLINISIDSLISFQPDLFLPDFEIKMDLFKFKLQVTKSLKKLAFMLDLARIMSPCIVWIPDLHKLCLDADPIAKTMHSNSVSLLTTLLATMNQTLSKHFDQKILFVGSTNNTKQIDPALISPMRLNKLIHLRMPNSSQREEQLRNLLHGNGIFFTDKVWLMEAGNRTIGYTWKDLSGLNNEICLIHATQVTKYINTAVFRLALHRQIFGIDNTMTEIAQHKYYEEIPYKVGKALIQSTFLNNRSMHPLHVRHHLWKTRFYILSKVFLEPNTAHSAITELMTLPYILNCLSGSAARDAWILSTGKLEEHRLSLSNQVKHDLILASSLFERLFTQLAFPNMYSKVLNSQTIRFLPKFKIMENMLENTVPAIQQTHDTFLHHLNGIRTGIAKSISDKLGRDLTWSPRTKRFDLYPSSVFGVRKLFVHPTALFSLTAHGNTKPISNVDTYQFEYSPYERRMLKVQQQQENNLQTQLNTILFKERAESMGLPIIYTDLMEYKESRNPIFFLGGRPILDLQESSTDRNVLFSRRNLIASTDVLTVLYASYGAKQKLDKPRLKYRKPPLTIQNEHLSTTVAPKGSNTDIVSSAKASKPVNFDWFRTLVQTNSFLQRPQLSFRVYSYQSWISQSTTDSIIRLDSLHNQHIITGHTDRINLETLVSGTIIESYHHLLYKLLFHKILLGTITNALFKQNILFAENLNDVYQSDLLSRCINRSK